MEKATLKRERRIARKHGLPDPTVPHEEGPPGDPREDADDQDEDADDQDEDAQEPSDAEPRPTVTVAPPASDHP